MKKVAALGAGGHRDNSIQVSYRIDTVLHKSSYLTLIAPGFSSAPAYSRSSGYALKSKALLELSSKNGRVTPIKELNSGPVTATLAAAVIPS